MFTSVGIPSIEANSDHVNNVEVNNFAVTIRDAYPQEVTTYAKFVLMKGTVPTDFSGLTASTSRSSDRLVVWNVASGAGSWVEETNSIYLQSTDLATASQSGTATWLWWYNPFFTNYNYTTVGISHQAVFTVGELGSGSDYELANVGIVNGKGYKLVNGPRLSLATEYTY